MILGQTFGKNPCVEITKWRNSGLLCLEPFSLWGQSLCAVSVHSADSAWFMCQSAQPDVYSLTHRLFLPFYHLWQTICCRVCRKWVEKQSQLIPVLCSPHSWAASVKPSTLPRPLWRRNMPDVSFTETNHIRSVKRWSFSSPQCWYHQTRSGYRVSLRWSAVTCQWWLTVNHKTVDAIQQLLKL